MQIYKWKRGTFMKCLNCGKEFEGNFCPYCGTKSTTEFTNYTYSVDTNYPKTKTSQKWYEKTQFTVFMIFLFFPIGLFLMWKYRNNWHIGVKIAITALIIFIIVIPTEEKDEKSNSKAEISSDNSNTKMQKEKDEKKKNATNLDNNKKSSPAPDENNKSVDKDYSILSESDYKSQCQELWHDDIFFSDNDLEGQLVKLDLFVEEGRFFESDAMYNVTTSDFIKEYDLQRSFYFCGVPRKDDYSYMGRHISLYFTNKYGFSSSDMKEGDHLIVYGEIIDYSTMTSDGYNSCGIIPRFIENNGQ